MVYLYTTRKPTTPLVIRKMERDSTKNVSKKVDFALYSLKKNNKVDVLNKDFMKQLIVITVALGFFNCMYSVGSFPENEFIKKVPVAKVETLLKDLEKNAEFKKRYAHFIEDLRAFAVQNKLELGSKELHAMLEQKMENKKRKIICYDKQVCCETNMLFPQTVKQKEKLKLNRKAWETKIDGLYLAKIKGAFYTMEESSADEGEKEYARKKTGYEDPKITRTKAMCVISDIAEKSVETQKKLVLLQNLYHVNALIIAQINRQKINDLL